VEEDEDGFVNTGGGADIGGLFRRRKKEKNPPKAAPAKLRASSRRSPRRWRLCPPAVTRYSATAVAIT
jgi:hypothetical protein